MLFAKWKSLLRTDWYRGIFAVCVGLLLPEYMAVVALIPALIFLIRAAKAENRKPQIGRLGLCLIVYIATMYVSIAVSLHPLHSLLMSLLWTVLPISYFLVTTVLTDRERLRVTLKTLGAVLGVCGVISILQYLFCRVFGLEKTPLQFWEPLDKLVFSYFPMELILDWADVRTAAVFNNPNLYGQFTVMLLPFVLYNSLTAEHRLGKRVHGAWGALCLLGVLFTFSRGSYLGLILMVLMYLALSLARSKTARRLALVAAVAAILFVVIPNPFMDRLASISIGDIAVNARLQAWTTALEAIAKRPILGYGAGTLNAMDLIQSAGIAGTPHTHNTVLELLVEGGVLSLLPFLLICAFFLADHQRIRRFDRNDRFLSIAFLSMFFGFALNIMVDYPFSVPKLSIVFMMLLGFSDVHFDLCGVRALRVATFRKGK